MSAHFNYGYYASHRFMICFQRGYLCSDLLHRVYVVFLMKARTHPPARPAGHTGPDFLFLTADVFIKNEWALLWL